DLGGADLVGVDALGRLAPALRIGEEDLHAAGAELVRSHEEVVPVEVGAHAVRVAGHRGEDSRALTARDPRPGRASGTGPSPGAAASPGSPPWARCGCGSRPQRRRARPGWAHRAAARAGCRARADRGSRP